MFPLVRVIGDVPFEVYTPIVGFCASAESAIEISALFSNDWLPFRNTPSVFLPESSNFPSFTTDFVLSAFEYIPIELSPLKLILVLFSRLESIPKIPFALACVPVISSISDVNTLSSVSLRNIPFEFLPRVIFLTPVSLEFLPSTYAPV